MVPELRVRDSGYGSLVGYRGRFEMEVRRVGPGDIPPHMLGLREDRWN